MMIIANPIYDVVFKYMMANLEVARAVIGTIIDEDIVTLDFKAQEHIHKLKDVDFKKIQPDIDIKELTYFRLDFIAKIKTKTGVHKNVLIELQKTSISHDLMRFRRYVGEQYKKEDEVVDNDGLVVRSPLPIITIYFLGYKISPTLPGVIKVNRHYIDVLSGGKEIEERNDFIECLSHNSYVIQIPSLHLDLKTNLERVLSVFQQENFVDKTKHLKRYEHESSDRLLGMILNQLQKAAGNQELHEQIEVEEAAIHEFETAIRTLRKKMDKQIKELEQKGQELEQKGQELEQKGQELDQKDQQLDQKDQQLDQKDQQLDQKDQQLDQKDQQLDQKDQQLDQKDQQLDQKDQQLDQKDQQLEKKDRQIQELLKKLNQETN